MSYDIWLTIDTGGPERACIGENWNYTSNCAQMWRAAGADLDAFSGKTAGDCAHILGAALATLRALPERFEAMDPENGWGSYASLVPALDKLLALFEAHPLATVTVHR